jgi:hypothetical protein
MGFWLIQRGSFNNLKNEYKGLTGREGLIDLDYMGSSEFEWGAIPKAYRRIMGEFDQYVYHYIHEIKDYKGKLLVIFCQKEKCEAIETEIRNFIEKGYQLKEFCTLKDHIKGKGGLCSDYTLKKDFFWCIDMKEFGDWMGFFSMDKLTPFKTAITNDYNNWWMTKTAEERETEYQEAFKRF